MDGEIVLSTPFEGLAVAEMEELKAARQAPGRELLRREMAVSDVRAFRVDSYAAKQSRDQKRAAVVLVGDGGSTSAMGGK